MSDLERIGNAPEIKKYLRALKEDFSEEYPRLPPEANPLDPIFLDPRLLAPGGDALLAHMGLNHRWMMRGGGGGGFVGDVQVPAELLEGFLDGTISQEEFMAQLRERFGIEPNVERLHAAIRNIQNEGFRGPRRVRGQDPYDIRGQLDPTMPLLQLFWQTLLPWNEFTH